MKRLDELLSRITELTDAELEELRVLIMQQVNEAEVIGDGTLGLRNLHILASAAKKLSAEHERREEKAQRAEQSRAVLASFCKESRMVIPADRLPRSQRGGGVTAVTASGQTLSDAAEVNRALSSALNYHLTSGGVDGAKERVVTLTTSHSGPRLSRNQSAVDVAAAVTAAATAHETTVRQALADVKTLTAAGGLGAFRETDFSLPGFESTARPL